MDDFLPVSRTFAPNIDFGAWVGPHLRAMSSLAGRLVSPADRDDVVQESLWRAWKRWSTFDPARGNAQAWLLAIVADRARRNARQQGRRATPAFLERTPGYEADLDLAEALRGLSRRQRLAIELYYYLGMSVSDTAEVMDCAQGTVKSTLADARTRLRRELGEQ
jgi:RNA polymerase sigma-70 factor (ECF subfamily)